MTEVNERQGQVEVRRTRVAYDERGDGRAVVLLHPGVADRRCWSATAEALGHRYRVIAHDRRGFGDTIYESEGHDPVNDVRAVLDALDVDEAALVGNSMGGRLAIDFALAYPSRVWALVLVATAVRGAPKVAALDADIRSGVRPSRRAGERRGPRRRQRSRSAPVVGRPA